MENMNYSRADMGLNMSNQGDGPKKKEQAPLFNIKDFAIMLLMNWFWFVLSGIVSFGAGYLYVKTLVPQYERSTDLQIKFSVNEQFDMQSYLGISDLGVTNMSNELYILNSLKLATQVSDRIHFDVSYFIRGAFRHEYLFENRPFTVSFLSKYDNDIELDIMPVSPQQFRICKVVYGGVKTEIDEESSYYYFGADLAIPGTEQYIRVDVTDEQYPSLVTNMDEMIVVQRISPIEAAKSCRSKVTAEKRAAAMVRLICVSTSVAECDSILRAFVAVYNQQTLEEKNALTVSSAKFVDERIEETAKELGETEGQLFDIGVDPNLEVKASDMSQQLGQRDMAQEELYEIQAKMQAARDLKARMQTSVNEKDYIPQLAGLDEAGISGQVQAYNEMVQKRKRLIANSSVNNPAVLQIDDNLASMEPALMSGMDSYLDALNIKMRTANSKVARYSAATANARKSKYDSTSVIAQSLSITREYKQSYFSFLLKKREELRLQIAVSEADTRLIEDPMGELGPISPVVNSIMIKFVGIGLALPALIMLLIVFLDSTVRGRKDIEDALSMPFIGEVPGYDKNKDDRPLLDKLRGIDNRVKSNKIVITNESKNALAEGMHIVQSNLSFMTDNHGNRAQVILFTSFSPGAGKSFVSCNLASCMANTEKRSIWIDMDIRKGHKNPMMFKREDWQKMRHGHRTGLSAYLSGKAELEDCIFVSAANPQLDIMPAGQIPPNPVQLLMSDKLDQLIADFRKKYEYIILDTVPAALIADSFICSRLSDLQIFVVRAGVTQRNVLPEVEKIYQSHKYKNLTVLLNGATMSRRRYGGYGYGYGYGETDEDMRTGSQDKDREVD